MLFLVLATIVVVVVVVVIHYAPVYGFLLLMQSKHIVAQYTGPLGLVVGIRRERPQEALAVDESVLETEIVGRHFNCTLHLHQQ